MTDPDVDAVEMFEDPELEAFVADLRQAAADTPAPRLGAVLAAVLDGSMAPSPSDVPVPTAGRLRHRGLGRTLGRLDARARVRLVLGAGVAAAVLVVITAAGGGLPQPAQRNVARLADQVGVSLPDGDDTDGNDAHPADDARRGDDHRAPAATSVPTRPPAASPTTPSSVTRPVVPESVADADAVEDLRDGDDDPTTPGRAEEAPGQVHRPTDDRGRDEEQRELHQPEEPSTTNSTTKAARPETPLTTATRRGRP